MKNKDCLICSKTILPFVDFGNMPIANSFMKIVNENEYLFSMQMAFCKNCHMVQLVEQPAREKMFHENYAFFSSTSDFMKNHFYKFYEEIKKKQKLNEKSLVVEIGCNDGIMLENFVNSKIPCLGVEPSKNVAKVARQKGIEVFENFFDKPLAEILEKKYGKADVIFSANVMCHIPYLGSVFEGIHNLLKPTGIFAFEDPYLGDVMNKNSFDQIYDEHVFLFSALSIQKIAKLYELELINVQPQNSHGGSMRYTLAHKGQKKISNKVNQLINDEKKLGLNKKNFYFGFEKNINKIKKDLINLLLRLKKEKKKVVGYGATSKSTTIINYFDITKDLIECIYDTTPGKFYTFSPGKHLPILPYSEFRKSNPDYVVLFAWNHANEIMQKEKEYMKNRNWILYVPQVSII
jgi:methylation protein EvaC